MAAKKKWESTVAVFSRVGATKIFRKVFRYQKPFRITRFGKPYVMIVPHSFIHTRVEDVQKGKITWDDFRDELMQKGYQDMMDGKVRVHPNHIIAAEKVQTDKQSNKIQQAEFMLKAAQYFQSGAYVCPHCEHHMIPETMYHGLESEDEPIKEISSEGEEVSSSSN